MVVDRLITKMKELGAPIVVGLDPRMEEIPGFIMEACEAKIEKALDRRGNLKYKVGFDDVRGVFSAMCFEAYMKEIIDHVYDLVPAVKLQIAMYEEHGADGIGAYHKIIGHAREKGLVVIGDIKRGDISSTAAAYSRGHIGFNARPKPATHHYPVDFATISPFLGKDSVDPFLEDAKKFDRGLFALVKTSNKGSRDIQDQLMADGRPLYQHVGRLISEWGADSVGKLGYSRLAAVVGATHPQEALELRKLMPHTLFLVPGYGAQGASGKDLRELWTKDSFGMIVNSSRGITGAYKSEKHRANDKDFACAAREAVVEMKNDLGAYIT